MPSKEAIRHSDKVATCLNCGCEFPVFQSEIDKGRRFCSRACACPLTVEQRIAKFTKRCESGCIEWTGGRHTRGYGLISVNHKMFRAHRLVWELSNGPIPEGFFVLHRCDNPPCCNIDHLFLGTGADNVRDKMEKNRHRWPRGEQGNHKLTESEVIEILSLKGTAVLRIIAERFGVSEAAIHNIYSGRTWAHIPRMS